mmetsp:Transcript_24729/g.39735  ORF Transcript_24729/g.39735 Transcript_24729/m.39735 type:complete len:188 (-) Transcript_24729:871-1434(-)
MSHPPFMQNRDPITLQTRRKSPAAPRQRPNPITWEKSVLPMPKSRTPKRSSPKSTGISPKARGRIDLFRNNRAKRAAKAILRNYTALGDEKRTTKCFSPSSRNSKGKDTHNALSPSSRSSMFHGILPTRKATASSSGFKIVVDHFASQGCRPSMEDETLECAEFYIPNHQRFGGEKIVSYSSIAVDS